MKNVIEAIQYAREYLWAGLTRDEKEDCPTPDGLKLHGSLQYRLCEAVDRLVLAFGEVTRKDVALIVEAWNLGRAQGSHERPYQLPGQARKL